MTIVEPKPISLSQERLLQMIVRPVYSIVAPVFNEQELLPEFYQRVKATMDQLGEPWELVLINDGSHDRTPDIMRELNANDSRVKVINFSRNFGHQLAITAGIDYAGGKAVVVIDSDLQDPPEVIPNLIAAWKKGSQVVFAVRTEREGETAFKKATASAFYRIIRNITNVDIPVDTGDFRLMDRKVVDALKQMREQKRFMRGLSVWVGFKQSGVGYKRDARKAGETKYPFKKMFRFAMDGITAFSYLPLQVASYAGFIIAALGILGIIAVIVLRLIGAQLAGQATVLVTVLFIGGVQLVFLGLIGEYLGRIYDEVKRRPLYIVAEELGFDQE